jgi:hypothetical protein
MLQDLDNIEASCILYVKVSKFTHPDQSKANDAFRLSINQEIVRLTIQQQLIVSISFMYYPGDSLRQTSADILSL